MSGLLAVILVATMLAGTAMMVHNSKSTRTERKSIVSDRKGRELAASIDALERELEVGDHSPEMKAEAEKRSAAKLAAAREVETKREKARQASVEQAAARQAEAQTARIAGLTDEELEVEVRAHRIRRRAARPETVSLDAARLAAKEELRQLAQSKAPEKRQSARDRLKEREWCSIETKTFEAEWEIVQSILSRSTVGRMQRALEYTDARIVELRRDLMRHHDDLARYERAYEATEHDRSSGQAKYFSERHASVSEQIGILESKVRGVERVKKQVRQTVAEDDGRRPTR